jgi:hypothetical protein
LRSPRDRGADLLIERVDHPQCDLDSLPGVCGQLQDCEEFAAVRTGDLSRSAGAQPVVKQGRADPQQPLGALVDQRLS